MPQKNSVHKDKKENEPTTKQEGRPEVQLAPGAMVKEHCPNYYLLLWVMVHGTKVRTQQTKNYTEQGDSLGLILQMSVMTKQ